MEKNINISKTVRLPSYLVEYIESCDGENFTGKLIGILKEYRDGDAVRKFNARRYDILVSMLSESLGEVTAGLNGVQELLMQATDVLNNAGSG